MGPPAKDWWRLGSVVVARRKGSGKVHEGECEGQQEVAVMANGGWGQGQRKCGMAWITGKEGRVGVNRRGAKLGVWVHVQRERIGRWH